MILHDRFLSFSSLKFLNQLQSMKSNCVYVFHPSQPTPPPLITLFPPFTYSADYYILYRLYENLLNFIFSRAKLTVELLSHSRHIGKLHIEMSFFIFLFLYAPFTEYIHSISTFLFCFFRVPLSIHTQKCT